ncbi:hypothetical protein [Corynebacterium afermentans]|uniref:Uncharacterized protein n=1 Tax=Corynebacterium afermentans TaxID=38286 RepID=A0A9X8R4C9_9CORY|nr:hypothetical protein [Corynebacterium afermentans]SIQ33651.1 hypothetical protein SAMN05421802_11163 [Corynebacterium afermentans]
MRKWNAYIRAVLAIAIAACVLNSAVIFGEEDLEQGGPLERAILSGDNSLVEYGNPPYTPWELESGEFRIVPGTEGIAADPTCEDRIAVGTHVSTEAFAQRVSRITDSESLVMPELDGMLSIGILASPEAGSSNPIGSYLSGLGHACKGVVMNPGSETPFTGLAVSEHEFGTVAHTEAGDIADYYSAYAVPGYIVLVYGFNTSLEYVREVSAAQSKAVEESIWLTPEGQTSPWTFGIVSWLRHFMGDRASETASA